jgi:hypothetical protein
LVRVVVVALSGVLVVVRVVMFLFLPLISRRVLPL